MILAPVALPLLRQWSRAYASTFARKPTRKQKIFEQNLQSQSTLAQIDHRFNILNERVTKVVDIGYVPGTWLQYAKERLLQIHEVELEAVSSKCTFIGTDLLCGDPIPGVVTTQGNIYSQSVHDNVVALLKESAFRRMYPAAPQTSLASETSYLLKELLETSLESELDGLAAAFNEFTVDDGNEMKNLIGPKMYQANLVLSDLAAPFLQNSGFYNNTYGRPYIRSSNNQVLRHASTTAEKAPIDLAEAALLLCFDALVKDGTFVARLAKVDLSDPELTLFQSRLEAVFHKVYKWNPRGKTTSDQPHVDDLYFICKSKRDYFVDKHKVFGVNKA